jgi:hypothetical protein
MEPQREKSLFSQFIVDADKSFYSRAIHWLRENTLTFVVATLASIGIHAALFIFLSQSQSAISSANRQTVSGNALSNIQRAQSNARNQAVRDSSFGVPLPPTLKAIPGGDNIGESTNSAAQIKQLYSGSRNSEFLGPPPALNELIVQRSFQKEQKQGSQDYTTRTKTLRREPLIAGSMQMRVQTNKNTYYVPQEYFYRKSPTKELTKSGADMFTVIEGFPELEMYSGPRPGLLQEKSRSRRDYRGSVSSFSEGSLVLLSEESYSHAAEMPNWPYSLIIADQRGKEILDDLVNLSENEQLNRFQENLLKQNDPDSPELARFTWEFIQNNLASVFILVSDISAAFDFMEEVYFNKPLNQGFYELWQEHSESRTGKVFLLSLAFHYHFERKALVNLFKAYDDASSYLKGRTRDKEIHNKKAKCQAIKKVCEELVIELKKRGYNSLKEVLNRYLDEERKIYEMLIERGGEERHIGLFALGCLNWEEMLFDSALEVWNRIEATNVQNQALQEIREVVSRYSGKDMGEIIPQVTAILDYHSHKNNKTLLMRLVQHSHWKSREK